MRRPRVMAWAGRAGPAVAGLLALTVAAGGGACRREPPAVLRPDAGAPATTKTAWGETPLVHVGGGLITLERFQRTQRVRTIEAQRAGKPLPDPRALLDALVEDEVLVQEAIRLGVLAQDEDVRDRLTRAVLAKALGKGRRPTPADLQGYYAAHRRDFPETERLRLRHILFLLPPAASAAQIEAARRKAEETRRQAAARPAGMPELVRTRSQDPSTGHGGEIGNLPLERWAALFGAEAGGILAKVEQGGIAPVLRSAQGFHVVQVVDRTSKATDPIEANRRELVAAYEQDARRRGRRELAASLRAKIQVQVDETLFAGSIRSHGAR